MESTGPCGVHFPWKQCIHLPSHREPGSLQAGKEKREIVGRRAVQKTLPPVKLLQIKSRNMSILSSIRTQSTPFPAFSVLRFRESQRLSSLVMGGRGGEVTTSQVTVDQRGHGEVSRLAHTQILGISSDSPPAFKMGEQVSRYSLDGWLSGAWISTAQPVLPGERVELHRRPHLVPRSWLFWGVLAPHVITFVAPCY